MMTIVNDNTQISNTWSVLRIQDTFGYGYQAQDSQFDNAAISEGWEVLFTGMLADVAIRYRDIYRAAGKPEPTATPDLSDLLSYDMTEPVEDRDSSTASEFDLIQIEWGGRVIEGVITFFDEDTVEIDGFIEVTPAYFLKHATLIAKADADSGFMKTYGAYLDELNQNWNTIYAFATNAQNRQELGEAA
jgi:hypothetical protein